MKRLLSCLLVLAMVFSMGIIGATAEGEPTTIVIYDAAANVSGEQMGWFAKVVKDKFNIVLDIVAPQVDGQDVFATRAADGYLGDIVLVDKSQFPDLVATSLV